jgi:hypothetical protein
MRRLLLAALAAAALALAGARPAAAQCASSATVAAAGADYTTVGAAVAAIPASLTGDHCILFHDSGVYNEQVYIGNFVNNGFHVYIGTVTSGARPTIRPPALSTAAFAVASASVTIVGVNVHIDSPIPFGIVMTSMNVTISSVSVSTSGPSSLYTAAVWMSSFSTLSNSSVTGASAGYGVAAVNATQARIEYSTVTSVASTFPALFLQDTVDMEVEDSYVHNANHNAVLMSQSDDGFFANTVIRSGAAAATVSMNGSERNLIETTYVTNSGMGTALLVNSGSNGNQFDACEFRSAVALSDTVDHQASSGNTFSSSIIENLSGRAFFASSIGSNLTVEQSTVQANAATLEGFLINSTGAVLTSVYLQNSGGGPALRITTGAATVDASELHSTGGSQAALEAVGGTGIVIEDSFIRNPNGAAAKLERATLSTIARSTLTSVPGVSTATLRLVQTSSVTVVDSYLAGFNPVLAQASTGTVIGGSRLLGTNGASTGVSVLNDAINLTVTSSVITVPPLGGGIGVNIPNAHGLIRLSSNTVDAPGYGIRVVGPSDLAKVWVTSNTVRTGFISGNTIYGIYLDVLASGATVQDNAVVFRRPGTSTIGNSGIGLMVKSSRFVVVERNRLSMPGTVTGLSNLELAVIDATDDSLFRYNDLYSTAPASTLFSAHLLRVVNGSNGVQLTGNVFSSSWTVSTASSSLFVDIPSQAGFQSNYNVFFSSNPNTGFSWGGAWDSSLAGWRTTSGRDLNSVAGDPLYADPTVGVDDFHPKSFRGRYTPSGFTTDAQTSPTVDAADPADPFGNETFPHGSRANAGSYGNTAQASLSGAPVAGCASVYSVGSGRDYATIQSAWDAIGAASGHTCIVIEDAGTYSEEVMLANTDVSGGSVTVMGRGTSGRPRVSPPPASVAAFRIHNASVSIRGIDVRLDQNAQYGIHASSGWVSISSVNVTTASPAGVSVAGISLSSWSAVSYTNVDVGNAPALRFEPSAHRSQVDHSTFTSASALASVYFFTASSSTLSLSRVHNAGGIGLLVGNGAAGNVVSQSSVTSSGNFNEAVSINGASSNTVSGSYVSSTFGPGIRITGVANSNVVSGSTISGGLQGINIDGGLANQVLDSRASGTGSVPGLQIAGSAHFTRVERSSFTGSFAAVNVLQASSTTLTRVHGYSTDRGLRLAVDAAYTQVSLSSFNGVAFPALTIEASTGNTITTSYFTSASSDAAKLYSGATNNSISKSTFVVANMTLHALRLHGASSNTLSGVYADGGSGFGLSLVDGAHSNVVSGSTLATTSNYALFMEFAGSNTVTGSRMSHPGGTAVRIFQSRWVTVVQSTVTGGFAGFPSLFANFVTSAAFSGLSMPGCVDTCLTLNDSAFSRVEASSMTSAGVTMSLSNSSWNTVTNNYLQSSGNSGLRLLFGSVGNTVSLSTVASGAAATDALWVGADSNTITGVRAQNSNGGAALISSADHTRVFSSTFVSREDRALHIESSTGVWVVGSYVQGGTATVVTGASYNTFLHNNSFAGVTNTNGSGCAVQVQSAGQTSVSSSTLSSNGDGACAYGGNFGLLSISSNVISARAAGVHVYDQNPNAPQVQVSSNSIRPLPGFANVDGVLLESLSSGATIENNSIYFRTPGGLAGTLARAFYARNSSNFVFRRNRVNMPDALTAGAFRAIEADNSSGLFENNDVHAVSLGAVLTSAELVRTTAGGSPVLRNNIFSSSFTASVAGSTYAINANGGITSNYNVFHSSSGALSFRWAAIDRSGLSSWIGASFQDAGSTEGNPLWANTASFFEDFHVKSTAGRYDPSLPGFVNDQAADSPSIDAGDPASAYGDEPAPNGFHANAGSTGGTAEASKSASGACAVVRKVCKTGGCPYTSIQAAVNSIPNPLVGHSCVFIRDQSDYFETVTVASFTLAGSSITIAVDRTVSTGAAIVSNSPGFAILDIRTASVTVTGPLHLRTFAAMQREYGVYVASPSVRLSSVNVFEQGGPINVAGIRLSTENSLSYSTISVFGNSVSALLTTGPHITVSHASASWSGGGGGTSALLYMYGSSSSTLTDVRFAASGSKDAARFEMLSAVTVDRATFTSSNKGLALADVDGFTLTGSVLGGGSQALTVSSRSVGVLIDRSSMSASPAGAMPGVVIEGRDVTLSRARVSVSAGAASDAIQLLNAVSARLSEVSVSAGGLVTGVVVNQSSSTVIENSSVHSGNASALRTLNGGPFTSITFSTFTSNPSAGTPAVQIQNATNTAISDVYIANLGQGAGLQFSATSSNTVTRTTVTASLLGGPGAVWLDNQSTHNLFTDLTVSATNASGIRFENGSADNVVRRAAVSAYGSGTALYVGAPRGDFSSMTVVAYGNSAAYFDGNADLSRVSYSSFSARGGNQVGLWLNGASTGTFTELYVAAINGTGLYLQNEASFNQISLSTVVGGGATPAFDVETSSSNLFYGGVVLSTGGAAAVRFGANSAVNVLDGSLVTARFGGVQAINLQSGAAASRVSHSRVVSDWDGVWLAAPDSSVSFTTVTASGIGVYITGTAVDVSTSYVVGSTAVAVSFSDMPRVRGSVLISTRAGASALSLVNPNNAVVSTNTLIGPAGGDGLNLSNAQGRTVISSNTFRPGPARQLAAGTQNVGSQLWVSTNVFYPSVDGSSSTYGIHLAGLNTGATIQNNDIRYDGLGSIGAGFVAYGFYATGSTGLLVERNRFANLTDVTSSGGLAPFVFVNSGQVTFRYNDVWSEESSNSVREMLAFHNTPNVTMTGNVFANGATLPVGNPVIVNVVDAATSGTFRSDYNDFHLSVAPARVGRWNNGTPLSFAAWQSASSGDANSISADPLWFSTATVFDFHPKSVGGRFNSAGQLFFDTVSAPTIDRGDPFDAIGAETFPGNNRVNMGSYAQTAQASRAAPPAGCSREITVPGSHSTIQDAILQLDGEGTLSDDPCIVVRTSPITEADLVVSGIDANNHRVTIMGEPGVDIALDLGSSVDVGFLVDNDSITVKGLRFFTSTPLDNMIRSKGRAVLLSSITVQGANLLRTGVSISSASTLSFSSVTSGGVAVQLSGLSPSVSFTTAATTAVSSAALRVDGGQWASLSGVYAQGALSTAAVLAGGALDASVIGSTFASQGAVVFHVAAASRASVAHSFVRAPNGAALRFEGGSYANVVSSTVLASTSPLSAAVQFSGGVNNTLQLSWIEQSAATTVVSMSGGARLSALSSMTILGSVTGTPLVDVVNASSNTFAALTVTNSNGPAMRLGGGASYNQVDQSTITSSLSAATVAFDIVNSSGNVVRRSYMEGANNALRVQSTANRTRVELSTMAAQNDAALDIQFSSYVAVSRSMVISLAGNRAMLVDTGHHTSVDLSTVSNPTGGGAPAIEFFGGKGNAVRGSYAEGGRGVYFGSGESNASVLYSEVHARFPGETAVWFEGTGSGFTVSSSVVRSFGGGAGSAGIKVLGLGGGQVSITTNTVLAGAQTGILIGTQAANGRVHVASNTVFPTLTTVESYGLMLDGVRSGATIQNNSVYYRDPGPQTGGVTIGIYVRSADGVLIERNRVSQPGVIDPGGPGSIGIGINGTPRALVRFNDIYGAGAGYSFAAAFAALQSTGIVLTNNAISSDFTADPSTRTIDMDVASADGLRLGYNLYHSSSGPVQFYRGGVPFSYPFNFVAVTDPDPVSHTPHWFSVAPGAEDFHPRSHAGRWDPALNAYVFTDQWTSAMVDRGDTAESFALEPADNGGRVNIGSYGGTTQASLTPPGPTSPAVASVTDDLIEVSFTDSGSPQGHIVGASTTPAFTGVTLSSSGPAGESTLAPSGLDPNTTYYLLTGAVWGDAVVFSAFITTVTRAEAPTAALPAFPEVFKTSATVRWNTAGNPLSVTTYTVTFSPTTPFPNSDPGNVTVQRLADASPSSVTATGLAPNTTYYAFVAALNHVGAVSSYLQYSTATRAQTPSGTGVSGVQDTYLTAFWAANGNPLVISTYVVQMSTAADFNFGASSVTLTTAPAAGPVATMAGLTPATTYYLRVAARSHDGELTPFDPAGFVIMLPLVINPPSGAAYTAGSSVTLAGNWGLSPGATGYTMVVSTEGVNPPVAVTASSTTVGQGNTNASVGGLAPNTTYFAFVRANGNNGNSLYTVFGATHTQPALPLSAVSTFTEVHATSFTVSWLANGNPLAMTTYTVVASTASDFNVFATSVTLSTVPAFGPTASLTGLAPYTLWHVQVRAQGHGGVTPFTNLGSTQTLPVPLDPPASVQAAGVSASSAAATWSLVLGATGYSLVAAPTAANPPVAPVWVSSVPGGGVSNGAVFGLAPLTTYFLLVRAEGPGNSGPWAVSAATATNPVAPAGAVPPFSIVASALLSHDFTVASNPVGIATYTVTLSSVAFPNTASGNQNQTLVPNGTSGNASFGGLSPNTTYHFFTRAFSHAGASFGAVTGSTSTDANAPSAFVPDPILANGISSVTVRWQTNGNPAITSYTVVASTASDFNAAASSVVFTTASVSGVATVSGLSFGTSWYFQVRAVSHSGAATGFASLGSTYTYLSNLIPLIVDNQAGDVVWRRSNNGSYDVDFQDGSGVPPFLDRVQVSVSTNPGGAGDLVAFTNVVTGIAAPVYTAPIVLPAGVFNAMLEGATNYVTVSVYNQVSSNTLTDVFYVLKDTTAPTFVNGEAGGDLTVQTAAGRAYDVRARDAASGLDAFQYSVSVTPGAADQSVLAWTDIAPLSGATEHATPWTVDFDALRDGATNYVSVRAWDMAGSTSTVLTDAFKIFKDTTGPAVVISSPNVTTTFVSTASPVLGSVTGAFGVSGASVAVQEAGSGLYWNGATFLSATPVWIAATGVSSWTVADLGVPFVNGQGYRLIARGSTPYGLFSTRLATASFTFDDVAPAVAVTSPAALATVASIPQLSGTAADGISGVSLTEVRLKRFSDGLWWNWFTEAWSATPISSGSAGGASWSVTPSALLQANMQSGSSYYIAVRASDNATPPNAGDFFAGGSTFTFVNNTPPAAITDLAAVNGPLPGDVQLTWTARGAHGADGVTLVGQYAIFASTDSGAVPSTAAAQVIIPTATVVPGQFQGYIGGNGTLTPGVTYFLYVAMSNYDGNWSAFSNQASTTALPAPSNSITGHVVNASTQGITAVRIDAFDATGVLVNTAFTVADGSGTYNVTGLSAGNYKIEASWTANGITSSAWIDGIPMGSVNIDFSLDINYALATLTGTLGALSSSGQAGLGVAGSGHRPSAAGSHVELFQGGREVARVNPDPTGRWTIGHLLPGSYAVRAYTGLGYTDFQNVDLAEGEIRTVGFVFNPLPDASVFAFPNPARHSTTIRFETALQPLEAQIAIFDLKGSLVREVPGNRITATATPGLYHYVWDLTNARGEPVASGVYLFMVKVKGGSENQLVKVIKKLAVVR